MKNQGLNRVTHWATQPHTHSASSTVPQVQSVTPNFLNRSEWMNNGYSHSHTQSLSCVDCYHGGMHTLLWEAEKGCLGDKGCTWHPLSLTPSSNTHLQYQQHALSKRRSRRAGPLLYISKA